MATQKEAALRTLGQRLDRLHALLPILACPICGGELVHSGDELVSTQCGAKYPVVEGVPVLLPSEMVAQGLGGQLGVDDNVSMHPYSDASNKIIESTPDGWVLDLGAGGKSIDHANVVQIDVFRFPMTDVVGSADCLPFKSSTFRAVVSQAVFEHLQYPEAAAAEVWRVLCPDGVAKIDTAFLQPEHAYPHHYFNATEAGLRHWFRDFHIEWSGVEPYQHPKWSLVWFLSVYFASLPDAQRETLAPVGLGDCIDVLSRLSRGVSTSTDLPIIQALDGLVPNGVRALAAGVAVRAIKRASDGVVPRSNSVGGGCGGQTLLAVERRLENLLRDRRMDSDYIRATQQMEVIAADRSRFLLHAREVASASALASARFSVNDVPTASLVKVVIKRLLPFLAGTSFTAPAAGEVLSKRAPVGREDVRTRGVTFVVSPQQPIELLDQFFSLAHQSHAEWEWVVLSGAEQSGYVRQLAMELAALDCRVKVLPQGQALGQEHIHFDRWALLTPSTVLDFDAVLEMVSLGLLSDGVPVVSDVDRWDCSQGNFLRCHGFVPDAVAPDGWFDVTWSGEDLMSVKPWVAYPRDGAQPGTRGGRPSLRPAYVPKPLFRLHPFSVA